jgi:hypothetical protein
MSHSHSKMPPVPPAARSPKGAPEAAPHAPQEEQAHARAAGPADKDNIRQNITNKGMQQDR